MSDSKYVDIKFQRVWDSTCPRVWDKWEANGKTWVIQDLRPEDDDIAIEILINHLCTDETLCVASNLANDPTSVESLRVGWKQVLEQRISLGCYTEVEGKKTLVAMNACIVETKGDEIDPPLQGDAALNVVGAMKYVESKCCHFEHLSTDKVLTAFGLVVCREYRGHKLGGRLLKARGKHDEFLLERQGHWMRCCDLSVLPNWGRESHITVSPIPREPLCLALGVKGSSTLFTGPASQKLAEKAGFTTALEVTLKELSDEGLNYPREETVLKYMMKKFE